MKATGLRTKSDIKVRLAAAVTAWLALSAQAIPAQPLTNGVALAYFAPENQLFYRMRYPDGGYREFQRSLDDLSRMDGANGWRARIEKHGVITVSGRSRGTAEKYVFERGRLVSYIAKGKKNSFDYDVARVPMEGSEPPYHFGSRQEAAWHGRQHAKTPKSAAALLKDKWKKSGRLRWPFDNPNENGFLYASLALLSLYLTAFRRRGFVISGVVLSIAFFVPLVMTASRGALLALFVGIMPSAIVHFRTLARSRWTYIVAATAIAIAAVWFSAHGTRLLTRGFNGKSSWSNETRLDMWRMASPMMVDAPGGWEINPGKAYLDWYEDFDRFTAPGSLINDHLSKMVRMSWPIRGIYVFCWAFLGIGLFIVAFKTGNAVPAGMVVMSAVAAWFNPLMINKWLWIVPLACLVLVLVLDRPWRYAKAWGMAAAGAICVVATAVGTIYYLAGGTPRPYGLRIYADGPRVCVRNANPGIWVVDDGLSLGGAFASKELRSGVAMRPGSSGVGYVRRCEDLPMKGFRRLLLGGDAGDNWLRAVSTDERMREHLPKEVVFISPPFPPSAIPPALFASVRVKYVTGEFNARYSREFDAPPPFVEIVPAMELYISGWPRYALDE